MAKVENISGNRTVTAKQLMRALKYCIKVQRPAFLWGPAGIGKSSVVGQLCASMGGRMWDVRLSQVEQTDLRGMPFYNRDTGRMEWASPIDLPSEEEAAKYPIVFLFLDEMNSAAPAVQAAAYQLVLDRGVGTYRLPKNCVVIAAGNREGDRGVTYRQPAPLANRFVHFEMRVDSESWLEWANNNKIHADVSGYIAFSPNSLSDFDPKSPSRSFATPRSWEFVSQLLDDECDESTSMDIISGTIGEGLALKFMAHRKHSSKMPKAKDVREGKVKEMKTKEISAMYSLATAVAYDLDEQWRVLGKTKEEAKWHGYADNVLRFFMDNLSTEILVMSMRTMLQQYNLPFTPKKLTNFQEFFEKYGKLVVKAASV